MSEKISFNKYQVKCKFHIQLADSKCICDKSNKLCNKSNCYVYGIDGVFSGQMNDGIFREGKYTKSAVFKDTEIVNSTKISG